MIKNLKSLADTPQRSGTHTPRSPKEKDDYSSGVLAEDLVARLNELNLNSEPKKDAFSQSVEWIATDKSKASLEERENSLLIILSTLANKYEPQLLTAAITRNVIRAFLSHRSALEATVSLQIIAIATALADEDHPDYDDIHEIISEFLPKLLKRLKDTNASVMLRSQMATAYAVLEYFSNFGGGGFNVDDICNELISIAEATTGSEAQLTSAALMGTGLVLTISSDPNVVIEELEPGLVTFLEMPNYDVKVSAAKLAGLFYEKYTADELDPEPLVEALEEVLQESARKTGKKDIRNRKSLVRDVLRTIEDKEASVTLTYVELSKQKSLRINSWARLFVIQHLKWVFGPGLHNQLANNPFVIGLLHDGSGEDDGSLIVEGDQTETTGWDNSVQSRTVDRRKARLEKLEAQGRIGA